MYWVLKFTFEFNIINIISGLEFVCGHRLEILNNFILEYVLGSPRLHLLFSPWLFDSWVPGTPGHLTPSFSNQLLPPTAPPNSPWGGLDLDTQREGLGQTWAACLILGLGVFSQSLGGLGNPLTHSWSRHRLCPNVDHETTWWSTFDISWKGRWQALGRGEGSSPQQPDQQLWGGQTLPAALCMTESQAWVRLLGTSEGLCWPHQ